MLAAFVLLSGCAVQRYDAQPLSAASSLAELKQRSLASPGLHRYMREKLGGQPAADWPPRQWNPELLTLAVFYFNPDLELARSKLAAVEASVVTAGQVPNPTLQLPLQHTSNPRDGESAWTLGLALDIPIETTSKRGLRSAEAQRQATAARLRVATTAWNLRSQLRDQLLTIWACGEKARLLHEQRDLDQSLLSLTEARARNGYTSARDLNQQRLTLIQSGSDLLTARKECALARVHTAGLIGVGPSALEGIVLDLTQFGHPELIADTAALQTQALLNRADVLEALELYEASQAALQLEVARQYPDIHLGPGYTFDQGARKTGFDFSAIELPLFNRNEGPIAEARAKRQEAAANVKLVQAKAWIELEAATAAYRATADALGQANKQHTVQQDLMAGSQRAFQLGAEDRLALELGRRTELAARLALLDATVQVQQALGKIEDAIQRPISERSN